MQIKSLILVKNERISALTHFAGALLAIAGLVLMVIWAARFGGARHVVSFTIFGASMIFLYAASAIYHFLPRWSLAKPIAKRVDYAMIFVLIAGTYTPITLVALKGGWGWSFFGIAWGLAVLGICAQFFRERTAHWLLPLLYLAMGWLIMVPFGKLISNVPTLGLWWLLIGGLVYSVGVIFYILEHRLAPRGWFGMHELFHLFVIGGSFSHFWMMLRYVSKIG